MAAILRTVLIIMAVLTPTIGVGAHSFGLAMRITVAGATLYNAVIILLLIRQVRLRGQRLLLTIIDILLVSIWVLLTWSVSPGEIGSPLFAFYYVVILFSALWFGVSGVLAVTLVIAALYLAISFYAGGNNPYLLVDVLFRHVAYLFLVAISAGYLVDTHKRERDQWTRSQVMLAQYQERFRAAQEVYEMLMPAHTPQIVGLDLASRWRLALREGGGDFYDVIAPTPNRVVLTVADVSGKHARGTTKLPLFKAAFLACAQVWVEPGEILQQVNRIVYQALQPDMFISACIVVIDMEHHSLSFANAGQDPPVLVREGDHSFIELISGGLLLGIDEHASYPTEAIALHSGDALCLYTDGITEARSPGGDEFGYDTLRARVQAAVGLGLPAEGIAENIFDAVTQHQHGESRHDDMTLLVMRYRPEERETPAAT